MSRPLTFIKCDDLAAKDWCPFDRFALYRMVKRSAIPHWRPVPGQSNILFPLEVCQAFLAGEEVSEHWLRGEMNIVRTPVEESVATSC